MRTHAALVLFTATGSAFTADHFWQLPGWPAPPKVTKRSCPLHPARLRRVPSLHHCSRGPTGCGPPTKGHPWPIAALAASMPLNPLRNDSTRPPDGAFGFVCEIGVLEAKQPVGAGLPAMLLLLFCFCLSLCLPEVSQTTRSPNPVRRPSGGGVERGVWHGCQTRNDGPGMALRDDPRNSTGARGVERSETRMPGALSLWLLSLCAGKEKVTRRKPPVSG